MCRPFLAGLALACQPAGDPSKTRTDPVDDADADADTDADADSDTDADTDTGTGPCTNEVIGAFPEDGDPDVYYKTDVRYFLAAEDPTAQVAIVDAAGVPVSGATVATGPYVTWSGDDLSPSTSYTATLTWACEPYETAWTTSTTGSALTVDVTGRVYDLDLTSGEWVSPAGVGPLLETQLVDYELLVSPVTVTPTEITILAAPGDGTGDQDLCAPSLSFPTAAWTDPYFEIETDVLVLDVYGFEVPIHEVELSGAFAPDGSRIQGVVLKGSLDTRPLVDLVAPGGSEDSVCVLVAALGVSCQPCPDGTGSYCLEVNVDNLDAALVPGADPLVVVDDADIKANPGCP